MTAVYAPLIEVTFNGSPVSGLIRASIVTTNSFSADTYILTFSISAGQGPNIDFWSNLSSEIVDVRAVQSSPYGLTYNSLITGTIDAIRIDPVHAVATLEGRDLSGRLVDYYRQQDFVNQTASEIAIMIAQYHGLTPVVTSTQQRIGRYYTDGYTKLSLGQFSRLQSDWDLLVHLAREATFDIFIQGTSLFFQPSTSFAAAPIVLSIREVQEFCVDFNINLATNSTAQVQSWNSHEMVSYSSLLNPPPGNSSPPSLPFLFSGSNYTSRQVADSMDQYTAELARLTTTMRMEMPWNAALAPRSVIVLSGTNSVLDRSYRIDTVERRFSASCGSEQTIFACQI